jgi:hypothetical protein
VIHIIIRLSEKSTEEFGAQSVSCYCGDVANSGNVRNALAKCLSDFGRVDGWHPTPAAYCVR